MRPFRGSRGGRISTFGRAARDVTSSARGEAAYSEEFAKWIALIDAAAHDVGLSRDQRAASIAALRLRQQVAANGARKLAVEDERQKAKAFRREQRKKSELPSLEKS
jgi:hypothetical protein